MVSGWHVPELKFRHARREDIAYTMYGWPSTLCPSPHRPFLFNRILVMLIVMAWFTSATMLAKGAYYQGCVLIVVVPVYVIYFYLYSQERWEDAFTW